MVVTDAYTMIEEIHRSLLVGQGGTSDQNHPVGTTRYYQQQNIYHHLDSSQVSNTEYNYIHGLTFLQYPSWRIASASAESLFRTRRPG